MPLDIDRTHTSPNQSSRDGHPITLIVVHATVGSYASSLSWLCSAASKVSSHYLISKTGHINQLVADDRAAWHAGASFWNGMDSQAIQDGSLGIELENLTGMQISPGVIHPPDPYPAVQLAAACTLIQSKVAEHHIPPSHIVRHLDIAIPKGRKTDPAGLDWAAFLASLGIYAPGRYRVRGVPIHEAPELASHIALGGTAFLQSGEVVDIDKIMPDGTTGHLLDGRGFVRLEQFEPL